MDDFSAADPPSPPQKREVSPTVPPLYTPAEQTVDEMQMRLPWKDGDTRYLLDLLWSGNPLKGDEGLYRTRQLPPERRFEIVKQLFWLYDSQVMEKSSKTKLWLIPALFGSCGSIFAILITPLIYPLGLALICIACGYHIWDLRRKRQMTRRNLNLLLCEEEDLRMLSVAMTFPRTSTGKAIAMKESLPHRILILKRLLPRIREEEVHHPWHLEHIHFMLHLLKTPYQDVDLTLSLLRVLAFTGNQEALSVVERLVRHTAPGNILDSQIHSAAVACHIRLQARLKPLEQAATLLRASHSPDLSPNELLRAVNPDSGLTPQGELLRAYTPPPETRREWFEEIISSSTKEEEIQKLEQKQGNTG